MKRKEEQRLDVRNKKEDQEEISDRQDQREQNEEIQEEMDLSPRLSMNHNLYYFEQVSPYENQMLLKPIKQQKQSKVQIQSQAKNEIRDNSFDNFKTQITTSSQKFGSKLKKKIICIRNRNINYFIQETKDRHLIQRKQQIINNVKSTKKINDPSKSNTFFFLYLALIKDKEFHERESFWQIFDHYTTIKKNKMTLPVEDYQIDSIKQEIKFYREIAELFFEDPSRAMIRAYLRNHSQQRFAEGKFCKFTLQGLRLAIQTMEAQFPHYQINCSLVA